MRGNARATFHRRRRTSAPTNAIAKNDPLHGVVLAALAMEQPDAPLEELFGAASPPPEPVALLVPSIPPPDPVALLVPTSPPPELALLVPVYPPLPAELLVPEPPPAPVASPPPAPEQGLQSRNDIPSSAQILVPVSVLLLGHLQNTSTPGSQMDSSANAVAEVRRLATAMVRSDFMISVPFRVPFRKRNSNYRADRKPREKWVFAR